MSKMASPVTGKPYGLAAVCRAWRIARSGIYRHRTPSSAPRRRGPMGALSDAALAAAIKAVLAASPFHGEGHRRCGRGCATPAYEPRCAGCFA
jgi:putative transposase